MKRKTRNSIYKALILIIALLFAFFPLKNASDIGAHLLINSIGFDGGADITATIEAVGKESQAIVGSGKTLTLAFNDINSKVGRNTEMAHCGLIVLGKDISTGQALSCLTQLLCEGKINAGCSVVTADSSAQEFINKALKVKTDGGGVTEYITYLDEYLHIGVEKLITFVKKLKSKSAAAVLPVLNVHEKEDTIGGGTSSNASQGGGAQPKPNEEKKSEMKLTKTAKTYGSKELVMDSAATRGFDWLNNITGTGLMSIENFEFKGSSYGTISADIEKTSVKVKINDAMHASINANVRLNAQNRDRLLEAILQTGSESREINDALASQFTQYVRRDLESLISFCKTEAVDLLGLSNEIYKYRTKEYTSKEDILQKTDVAINIDMTVY